MSKINTDAKSGHENKASWARVSLSCDIDYIPARPAVAAMSQA